MCNDVGYEVEEVGQTGRMRREKDRKKKANAWRKRGS